MSASRPREFDEFAALPYDVRLIEQGGEYRFVISELGIVGRGANVADAHRDMVERRDEHLTRLIDAGQAGRIPLPASTVERKALISSLVPFSIKLSLSVLALVIVVLALVPVMQTQMKDLGRAARKAGQEFPKGLQQGFSGMAEIEPLDTDKQDAIRKAVRAYLRSAKPIIDEIQDVFSPNEQPVEPQAQ